MKNIYLSLFLLCSSFQLNAQWTKIHESEQGNLGPIYALSEQEIFVAHLYQSHLAKIVNTEVQTTNFGHYGHFSDIQFVNQQVGYIGGGCVYVSENCPSTTLYKTIDNGENWENLLPNTIQAGIFQGISVPSENDIYLYAQCNDGLLHSSDAGYTWETIDLPEPFSPNSYIDAQFITPELGYIAFIDDYEIIPNGYAWQTYVLFTKDGGNTWEQIFKFISPNNRLSHLAFATTEIGFLVDQKNHIFKTTDGGESWDTLTIGSNQERIQNFELVNHKVAYLSTRRDEQFKSRIYKTIDGGLNWTVDATFDSVHINQLHFIDEENGFAGIGNALYQRTGIEYTTNPAPIEFEIFPNPSSEFISIDFKNISSISHSLIIRNQFGQAVFEKQLFDPYTPIPIQKLPPSIYYVELLDENDQLLGTKKLIKK